MEDDGHRLNPLAPVTDSRLDHEDDRRRNRVRGWLMGAVILALGLVATIANRDLPIDRNSFVYAKVCQTFIARGYNPLPIIADLQLSYGKPVAFSFLSVPLVLAFGVNIGLKLASFIGTALFLVVAYPFFATMNRRLGVSDRYLPIELAILFLNPLVFYQFWSAYPDSLFAAQVLLAFVLTDWIVDSTERRAPWLIVLLGLVIYFTILNKTYGLVLGLLCPVYLLFHWRSLVGPRDRLGSKLRWLIGVFGLLGLLVVLAKVGHNPTINLSSESRAGLSAGVSELNSGLANASIGDVWMVVGAIAFTFLLCFNVALVFLFRRRGLEAWPLAPTCFAVLFLVGYLPFGEDAAYNIRYFIPVLAFAVVPIAQGIQATKRGLLRLGLLKSYAILTGLLTVNYNVPAVYEALRAANEYADPLLNKDDRLHSLRLPQQVELENMIALINQEVEPGGDLYWVSSYYDDATYGVIQELGLKSDMRVQCVKEVSDLPGGASDRPFHVAQHIAKYAGQGERWLMKRFAVTPLGPGVARVAPPIWIASPERSGRFEPGQSVPLRVIVEPGVQGVARVEFLIDGEVVATVAAPPYEVSWAPPGVGVHHLTAAVYRPDGSSEVAAPRALFVGRRGFERHVVDSSDDAEEALKTGAVGLKSSDLELVHDDASEAGDQLVGLRFTAADLPPRARVRRAYLQFPEYGASTGTAELTIRAQLAADSQPFARRDHDLSSRPRTSTAVEWRPALWQGRNGWLQRTPDLAALVEEVISLPDWRPGNSLAFFISGKGRRVAYSADGASTIAEVPSLYIELREEGDPDVGVEVDPEVGPGLGGAGPIVRANLVAPTLAGAELYATYCALCHGKRGEGYLADHANALANPDFLAVATDGFLRKAIAEGRPGTPMSAWSHRHGGPLSDPQVTEIVAHIRKLGEGQSRRVDQASEPAVDRAAAIVTFRDRCAGCHGADGDGDTAVSLNNPNFLASASDEYLRRSIAEGRRSTPMLGFGTQLSAATIDGLVALIRSWQRPVEALPEAAVPHLSALGGLVTNPNGGAPAFALREQLYVPVAAVAAAMAAGQRMIIVDARATSDWQVRHIAGAIPMPFYSIDYEAHALANDGTWVIAYCACPHAASGTVIEELRRRGFRNTAVLDEGYDEWVKQGFPTQRGVDRLRAPVR